jgi:CRISPR-associated protein Cmr6
MALNMTSLAIKTLIEFIESDRTIEEASKHITLELYKEFECNKIKDLINNVTTYVNIVSSYYNEILSKKKYVSNTYIMTIKTPLLVHTHNPYMPINIGLSWHPIFNLPYIPSTTIKGVLNRYLLDEKDLIILDSFPVSCKFRLIVPQVITPHYVNEFSEHKINPTPLIFPAIAPGVGFNLTIFSKKKIEKEDINKALFYGLGAKTSIGYGFVEI